MSRQSSKFFRNLRLWWLVLSGSALKFVAAAAVVSFTALIAVEYIPGTNNPKENVESVAAETTSAVPQLVLLDKESATLRSQPVAVLESASSSGNVGRQLAEIPASGKGDNAFQSEMGKLLQQVAADTTPVKTPASNEFPLLAQADSGNQSSIQMLLKDLVNQAMNPAESSEAAPADEDTSVQAEQAVEKTDAPKTTNDLLKELVGGASATPAVTGKSDYISRLSAESDTTVVIDEKTAQQPAANATLSNSDRIRLIQNIASRVAQDTDDTADNVDYVTVEEQDSLWLIAKRLYNDPYKYKLLYSANRDILLNENSLIVGQKLRVPKID